MKKTTKKKDARAGTPKAKETILEELQIAKIDLENERDERAYENFKHKEETQCLRGKIGELEDKIRELEDINDFLSKQLQKHWRETSRVADLIKPRGENAKRKGGNKQ